jgi:hypothetical protein
MKAIADLIREHCPNGIVTVDFREYQLLIVGY